jgi:hypothetical protein
MLKLPVEGVGLRLSQAFHAALLAAMVELNLPETPRMT